MKYLNLSVVTFCSKQTARIRLMSSFSARFTVKPCSLRNYRTNACNFISLKNSPSNSSYRIGFGFTYLCWLRNVPQARGVKSGISCISISIATRGVSLINLVITLISPFIFCKSNNKKRGFFIKVEFTPAHSF